MSMRSDCRRLAPVALLVLTVAASAAPGAPAPPDPIDQGASLMRASGDKDDLYAFQFATGSTP